MAARSEATRARMRAAHKKQWEDPAFRARASEAMKRYWEKNRAKRMASLTKKSLAMRHTAAMRRIAKDPEVRVRRIAGMKRAWSDPEKAKLWKEALKAGRLAKKLRDAAQKCPSCQAGNHLACDGGACTCSCAAELDRPRERKVRSC